MSDKIEKKKLAILRILSHSEKPVSSLKITEQLIAIGYDVNARTVRYYFQAFDNDGFTENIGKKGRRITEKGRKELENSRIIEKVGYLAAKIDQLTYQMDFNLARQKGTVIINISILAFNQITSAASLMSEVFKAGYAMGQLMAVFGPGERVRDTVIPHDCIGIGTVCSVSLNGILLDHGISTNSRFGGLLELKDHKPIRFLELIHYEGTTLDPLEVFISSRMTDYIGAVKSGNGKIGVGFREVPADSREQVIALAKRLDKVGLNGFLSVGWPGQPLLDIPVSEGRLGVIVIGGLNPVAILEEHGMKIHSKALAALTDFQNLFHYTELAVRVRDLMSIGI